LAYALTSGEVLELRRTENRRDGIAGGICLAERLIQKTRQVGDRSRRHIQHDKYAFSAGHDSLSPLVAAAGLEQEPYAALGLVDPNLDQAGRSDIATAVAQVV
jgi:hypothetical protein